VKRSVVVGTSAVGLLAAETLRRESDDGTPPLIGDEPHQPCNRPPLSKQFLTGRRTTGQAAWHPTADLDAPCLGLRLRAAATGLDPAARTVPPTAVAGTEVGRALSQAHLEQAAGPRAGAVLSEVTEAKAALVDSEVVEGGEVLVALGSRPDTERFAVRGRVTCDAYARSRPACPRPGTWPAGRTHRS
jgi:hypothetical protein